MKPIWEKKYYGEENIESVQLEEVKERAAESFSRPDEIIGAMQSDLYNQWVKFTPFVQYRYTES